MKKIFCFLFLICLLGGTPVFAQQEEATAVDFILEMDGEQVQTKNPIVAIQNRTYLPLRDVAELFDLYVVWDAENQMIKISDIGLIAADSSTQVRFSKAKEPANPVDFTIKLNGYIQTLENTLYAIQGRTYLPVREIAELLDAKVDWIEESRTVQIDFAERTEHAEPVLIPFEKDGYCGYADDDGNVVIPPKYTIALPFSEGLAAVADEDYKFGYIDMEGNLVIPHQYFQTTRFSEGLAVVGVSDMVFEEDEPKEYIEHMLFGHLAESYFYINREGEKQFNREFRQAGDFHNGFAQVAIVENDDPDFYNIGDYFAYINQDGEVVKRYEDAELGDFQDGYAQTADGLINTDFEVVFAGEEYDKYSFHDGFITAKKDGKYGVVDLENNVIIDFQYDALSVYSEGLFACKMQDGYGYIDINGNIIIPPVYDYADRFIAGRAMVEPKDNPDIMYFIDRQGEQVSVDMDRVYYEREENGLTMIYPNNLGRYVNSKGESIE